MNCNIELAERFKKEAKKLVKKYPSLKNELKELFIELEKNPTLGTLLIENVFKIRLAINSKNKGKSGGARVIYYADIDQNTILILTIYNKGEKNTISDKEIQKILDDNL